jgi:hypothetical protein
MNPSRLDLLQQVPCRFEVFPGIRPALGAPPRAGREERGEKGGLTKLPGYVIFRALIGGMRKDLLRGPKLDELS